MPPIEISTGPPASALTATSSSVIAEAIQSALRCETRPLSAVTRPPPPRVTTRSPASSRSNWAGPRLETITSRGSASSSHLFHCARTRQLRATSRSPNSRSQSRSSRGVRKCSRACSLPARARRLPSSGSLRISMQRCAHSSGDETRKPVSPSLDLERDPTDVAGDRRPSLPQRLGDGEAEALADRLLDHDVGLRLERVDLDRADVVEVVEDLDVGVAVGVAVGLVEELPALGVVGRHRADERELDLGHLLA